MKVHTYERVFLTVGAIMLVAFLAALLYASVAMGIHLPGPAGKVEPTMVMRTPPFNAPGVHQTGPNQYQAVIIGFAWGFTPAEIRVPAGADVTRVGASYLDGAVSSGREAARVAMGLLGS